MPKILAKGETGKVTCEYCLQLFEFEGNGEWIPTICPECEEQGRGAFYSGLENDRLTFDELDAWFWDGVTE